MSHLIWLGFVSLLLKVNFLLDSSLPEDMMTAADAHIETYAAQKVTQVIKCDIRISLATQYLSDQPFVFAHEFSLLHPSSSVNCYAGYASIPAFIAPSIVPSTKPLPGNIHSSGSYVSVPHLNIANSQSLMFPV